MFFSGRLTRLIVAVVAIGLLLFAAWSAFSGQWSFLRGFEWRSGVRVTLAELRSPDRFVLNVASCNGDPEVVLLRETDVDVQVKVVSSRFPFSGGGNDCADGVEVQLQQPLGDRTLVDKHTGQPVSIKRAISVVGAELRSPDRLDLSVDSCRRNPQLALRQETSVEVQVMVVAPSTSYRPGSDCQDIVNVRLQEPFGDRILVDMHTGQPVSVEPGPNAGYPAEDENLDLPDVAPPEIGDPPNEAELQDLQRIAIQKGLTLEEAIDRYAWNDNFSLLAAKIRSDFPAAFAGAEIVDTGGAWIGFAGPAPEEALDIIDLFSSSHSAVSVEVRTGIKFTEAELQKAIPAAHYAVYESPEVRDATTSFDVATGRITTTVILESTASDSVLDDLRAAAKKSIIDATRADFLNSITYFVVRSNSESLGGPE